jgi:hypothetical protein
MSNFTCFLLSVRSSPRIPCLYAITLHLTSRNSTTYLSKKDGVTVGSLVYRRASEHKYTCTHTHTHMVHMLAPLIRECLIVAASCPNTNVLFGRTVHVPAVSGSLHHALHMRTVEHHHIQAHNTYLLHTRTPKLRSYTHFAAPQSKPRPSTSAQRIPPRRALPQA